MLFSLCPWLWPQMSSLPCCHSLGKELESPGNWCTQSWLHRTFLLLWHFKIWKLNAHILQVDWKWNCLLCTFYVQIRFWNVELLCELYLVLVSCLYQQYGVTLVSRPVSYFHPLNGSNSGPQECVGSLKNKILPTNCLLPAPHWRITVRKPSFYSYYLEINPTISSFFQNWSYPHEN